MLIWAKTNNLLWSYLSHALIFCSANLICDVKTGPCLNCLLTQCLRLVRYSAAHLTAKSLFHSWQAPRIADINFEIIHQKGVEFCFLNGPFPPSFSLFCLFNTFDSSIKISPMTGFELQTSGVGSDRSINWATTTTQNLLMQPHAVPQIMDQSQLWQISLTVLTRKLQQWQSR